MQVFFVTLFEADLAEVFGAAVIGVVAFFFELVEFALVDAADVADDVRKEFALRILTEQARIDVDAGKAVAVGGETRDLFVGEAVADRQALEAFAFFEKFFETTAVARRDFHHRRERVDQRVDVLDLARRDFQRVGGVVVREHDAVAIDDDAAVGHDGCDRDAVGFGQRAVVLVLHHLQPEEAQEQHEEHEDDETRGDGQTQTEVVDLALRISEFDAGVDVQLRHGRDRASVSAAA